MKVQVTSLLSVGMQQPAEFLLVPEGSSFEEKLPPVQSPKAPEALPPVWQDFFDCTGKASSPEYIAQLACNGGSRVRCEEPLAPRTVFRTHLCPEALVRRHRLGLPEIRRIYQALQVYSLGFHQTMSETACHAADRGSLLVAIWRGFAMLWDGALQVIFSSETVKLSKEQQAASMSAEATLALLRECEASRQAMAAQNEGLRERMEEMAVEMLSAKADASVLSQSADAVEVEVKQLQREEATLVQQLEASRSEVYGLRAKLQELGAPHREVAAKAERLGKLLEERQEMLAASLRREAAAREERAAAQNLARAERLKRESVQARAQQLQAELDDLGLKLRALQAEHSAAVTGRANQQEMEDRLALLTDADRKGEAWRARAEAAESKAAALEEQLQAQIAKNEELVDSFWPLASKLKDLEAQLGSGAAG